MVIAPAFDLVGALAFLGGSVQAVRLYRRQQLMRNYWLIAATGSAMLGVWGVVETAEGVGLAPVVLESRLQILVLTTGLTAVVLLALYDNTEGETLLRQLETSERRTSTVVERFPRGAVVLVDESYVCLLAGGDDLFGRTDVASLDGQSLLAVLDDDLRAAVEGLCRRAIEGETVESEITHGDDVYQVRGLPVEDVEADRASLLVVRNVTRERRRERTLRRQRDELETLDRINRVVREVDQAMVGAETRSGIEEAVCDSLTANGPYEFSLVAERGPDGQFHSRVWSGADGYVEEVFPFEPDDPVGRPGVRALATGEIQVVRDVERDPGFGRWREPGLGHEFQSLAVVPVQYGDRSYGILAVFAARPDAFDEREQDVLLQFGETVGHAITAVERKEQADVLTALHGVARDLLYAETAEAVCDVVIDAGRDLLDVEIAIFGYDEARATLEPLGASPGALEFYGADEPRFDGRRESVTWRTFVSGETTVFDDVRTDEDLFTPDTDARSALFIPLGDHGVFAAGATAVGLFDDQSRKLVDLLAATTEAAFDRLESVSDLRERETQLRERTRRLERLQRINDIMREVDQALAGASSRAEIEQTVCDRLTDTDRYLFAWIGAEEDGVTPRAWAGEGASYLDVVDPADGEEEPEPAVQTLRTGQPTRVSPISTSVQSARWASEGVARGFRSALSVPVVHQGNDHGALTVYSGSPETFDEETTAVLTELGETVGYAIDATETKRGLHAARGTELELALPGRVTFLSDVASLSDGPVECVEVVPQSGGRTRVHFLAPGVTPAEIERLVDDSVVVERVEAGGQDGTFRATVHGETLSEAVVDAGAVPESIEVTPAETTLVVSLLPHVDARTFVDRLGTVYADVELVARRETGGERTLSAFRSEFEAALTDRQLEVLRTAYENGYFESPRESTGRDVADRLGISQPTVNYHVRESQRRLLGLLFPEPTEADTERED